MCVLHATDPHVAPSSTDAAKDRAGPQKCPKLEHRFCNITSISRVACMDVHIKHRTRTQMQALRGRSHPAADHHILRFHDTVLQHSFADDPRSFASLQITPHNMHACTLAGCAKRPDRPRMANPRSMPPGIAMQAPLEINVSGQCCIEKPAQIPIIITSTPDAAMELLCQLASISISIEKA